MTRWAPLLLALFCASCSKSPPPKPSPFDDPAVVAVVKGEAITTKQLESARQERQIPAEAVLDELIVNRALVQTARERGYDRDPEHIAAVERMLANRVREELRNAQTLDVSDAEIEARYRSKQKAFTLPAKARAAMIFVEAPSSFSEQKRAERRAAIESAKEEAQRDPSQFPALAAQYSYDQATKFRGGDIGYIVEGIGAEDLEPAAVETILALKEPGTLSEIVTTPKGFYLFRLTERIEGGIRPLPSVSAQIRAELQREKSEQAEKRSKASALANRPVEVRRERLPAWSSATPNTHTQSPPTAPKLGEP